MVVLEAADHYGGAVRTEELTLPGFQHDTFSSVYPAGAASPVFARMPLAEHGLEWVHPAACYATPLPDGDPGGRAVPVDRRDGGVAGRDARRRRRGVGGVRHAVRRRVGRAAGDDAVRLPAGRRAAEAAGAGAGRSGR